MRAGKVFYFTVPVFAGLVAGLVAGLTLPRDARRCCPALRRLRSHLAGSACYILIDPETLRVEGFRREPVDRWMLVDMSQDELMDCASVGCGVPLAQVFEGVIPAE